jgi:hypothetical protein
MEWWRLNCLRLDIYDWLHEGDPNYLVLALRDLHELKKKILQDIEAYKKEFPDTLVVKKLEIPEELL